MTVMKENSRKGDWDPIVGTEVGLGHLHFHMQAGKVQWHLVSSWVLSVVQGILIGGNRDTLEAGRSVEDCGH